MGNPTRVIPTLGSTSSDPSPVGTRWAQSAVERDAG